MSAKRKRRDYQPPVRSAGSSRVASDSPPATTPDPQLRISRPGAWWPLAAALGLVSAGILAVVLLTVLRDADTPEGPAPTPTGAASSAGRSTAPSSSF